MTKINNGGPAYPTMGNVAHNSDWLTEDGMTLRDWFAGKALTGLIPAYQSAYGSPTELVREAYGYADLMLAAREADPS